jgi:hypothetical protein
MSTLLVLGTLAADWHDATLAAAAASAFSLQSVTSWEAVGPDDLVGVSALVLGGAASVSGLTSSRLQLAETLRRDERLERVAIFAPTSQPTTADYVAALTSGIDDLLIEPSDTVSFALRLRAAREAALGSPPSLRRGLAWAVGPAGVRTAARARALRTAGFRAVEAPDSAGAPWLIEPHLALVVWETRDVEHALHEVRAARVAGALCRFVLCVPDALSAALALECEKLDGVRVLPEAAAPDSVVFLVNEMAESGLRNQRASRRRLASTLVQFRAQGRADFGLSYNVSAGGLYVRTLAPPGSGKIELSVEVGRGPATQLLGEVAWSRALSYDGTATVPPGFGVKIVEASEAARVALASLGPG